MDKIRCIVAFGEEVMGVHRGTSYLQYETAQIIVWKSSEVARSFAQSVLGPANRQRYRIHTIALDRGYANPDLMNVFLVELDETTIGLSTSKTYLAEVVTTAVQAEGRNGNAETTWLETLQISDEWHAWGVRRIAPHGDARFDEITRIDGDVVSIAASVDLVNSQVTIRYSSASSEFVQRFKRLMSLILPRDYTILQSGPDGIITARALYKSDDRDSLHGTLAVPLSVMAFFDSAFGSDLAP